MILPDILKQKCRSPNVQNQISLWNTDQNYLFEEYWQVMATAKATNIIDCCVPNIELNVSLELAHLI